MSLEEQIHAELVIVRRSSSVYLTEAAVGTRFPASLGAGEVLYSKESSRASGLLYLTKRGEAFVQEREPGTIAERGLALSN